MEHQGLSLSVLIQDAVVTDGGLAFHGTVLALTSDSKLHLETPEGF